MIRTRCPHCQKLLGIVDSGAGAVTTCPTCKKKFRAPAAKPVATKEAVEEFPEVEVVEEAAIEASKPDRANNPNAEVEVEVDDEAVERDDADEDELPRKKKKKGKKGHKQADLTIRNRIMGGVGAAVGAFLVFWGITHDKILNVTAQMKEISPSLESMPRYATIGFGVLLVGVGVYYLVIDAIRE